MCFDYPVSNLKHIPIAQKDITVYKIVTKDLQPYFGFRRVKIGRQKSKRYIIGKRAWALDNRGKTHRKLFFTQYRRFAQINYAIHSYIERPDPQEYILECVIPKGSPYLEHKGYAVSPSIKVIKKIQ